MTEAVSPAALEPLPDVYTAMGAASWMNLSICDLAVEGSPSSSTLMSPRIPAEGKLVQTIMENRSR